MSKKGGKCKSCGAHCAFEIALSGRQCSLFCLFAPFPHGYIVSRGVPDNCAFEIALSGTAMLTLLLVCAFSPRKYKSILRGFYNKESPERETNSLTSPGFSGILALRVSRTVASQDEESPSITRQGAGEIPVKATSRKVQQRYTARFIV